MVKKKILITGASGLIGNKILEHFNLSDFEITVLTRNPENSEHTSNNSINIVQWDCKTLDHWAHLLDGQDVVINLAGASLIGHRWNKKYKEVIYNSRIKCTGQLIKAISKCKSKPEVFISASAVGYYGDRGEELLTENDPPGDDFLAKLCQDWEMEASKVQTYGIRYISLRIGLVLSGEGGLLKKSILLFKLFVGGKLGSGKQYFPWIHIADLVGIINFAIENPQIEGPIICASPGIVREEEFAKTLGKLMHRPSVFSVPRFLLGIALGEIADSVLSSQNISVKKLTDAGYNFKFTDLSSALKQILDK